MRFRILVLLPLLLVVSHTVWSQKNNDTTVTFKVYGACEQCKDRIENAAKTKGVSSAIWDLDTRNITVTYNPQKTSSEKIGDKIVAAGHDLENKKAADAVYKSLPACCHYRQFETAAAMQQMPHTATDSSDTKPLSNTASGHMVKGVVMEEDNKGLFAPLQGASIVWLGTQHGVLSDTSGVFAIVHSGDVNRLVISYAGYKADTITITSFDDVKVILASNKQLTNVIVTSRQRTSFISGANAIRTQVMTEKELFKAACCNLSESFETNPSVDVSYNDAITGSKQIQLLGLSGSYTQLTVENLPGPRGIATPLGLNSIAGPWIESIQLTKGIGSVANGYESIAGQINVELKKPETAEKLYANLYVNEFGKTDLNLNLAQKLGTKWSTALLLHDDFFTNKNMDQNKDGFRDLPTGNQWSIVNRYKFDNSNGWLAQFGFKALKDERTGGQTSFNPSKDKFTTNAYGLGINTERYEAFAKMGYVFPAKKYQSFGLQLSAISHKQDSYFGLTTYNAKQQNLYGNLIYQSIIGNTAHKFRTGISFLYDNYDELFKQANYKRKEIVPGAFFEYTYSPGEKLNIVAGVRADQHNLFGLFITPRLHVKYEPVKGTSIRVSGGRGQRTANIFAENMSVFVSARNVDILSAATGKAYGLNAEVAWNYGIAIDQRLKMFNRDANLSLDFFRTQFANQVVTDVEDVRAVRFYNLTGSSFSNSMQAEWNFQPAKKLDVRMAYRVYDVQTDYIAGRLQKPLVARHRAFANFAYEWKGFKLDYTINFVGKKRIPDTGGNPVAHQLADYSPSYVLMNAQLSKTVFKKHPVDFYLGMENLTNYRQNNAILAASQPFSDYFDSSLIWGPVTGRMLYFGLRIKQK